MGADGNEEQDLPSSQIDARSMALCVLIAINVMLILVSHTPPTYIHIQSIGTYFLHTMHELMVLI